MTVKEFETLVSILKVVYPQPWFIPDQNAFTVWYEMLKDLDYKTANIAIAKYMQTKTELPTIAAIRSSYAEITPKEEDLLDEGTAWALVARATRNSTYNSEQEFDKLPKIVQRAVGSPAQLKEWATSESPNGVSMSVHESQFKQIFRLEKKRHKERMTMSPSILKVIDSRTPKIETRKEKHEQISTSEEQKSAIKDTSEIPDRIQKKIEELRKNSE